MQAETPIPDRESAAVEFAYTPRPRSAAALEKISELQNRSERKWDVRWSSRSGLPRSLAGGRSVAYPGSAREAAEAFVSENAAIFGRPDNGNNRRNHELAALREQQLPNGTKVTFAQRKSNLPILDAVVGVIVSSDGQIVHVSSTAAELQIPNGKPTLSPDEASQLAIRLYEEQARAGITRAPHLVIVPSDPPKLAYELELVASAIIEEPWQVVIDATDGSIMRQWRLVMESGATHVFCPNPIVALGDTGLRDENDADAAVPLTAYFDVQLENLDPPVGGAYSLKGAHVWMKNIDIPTNVPPTSPDGVFSFHRSDNGFEEVMAYYTLDRSQAYIQSLGFGSLNNHPQEVDAHGLFNFDNSSFIRDSAGFGHIEFGDGGVDDAEDADIILHEYGHAIHENSAPGAYFARVNNGWGNETGAMSEGFGDYWAASSGYDSSIARGFPAEYVGEWDAVGYADGPAPYLRVVNSSKVYPDDMVNDKYADAEIWSATLWDIFLQVGRETTDRLVLYSHYLVSSKPDFADGAQALIDADALLYPVDLGPGQPVVGAHFNEICSAVSARGMLTCFEICYCPDQGNTQGEPGVDLSDLGALVDEVFGVSMPKFVDPLCQAPSRGDYNCDDQLDAIDVSLAVDYLFVGGQPPCDPCTY